MTQKIASNTGAQTPPGEVQLAHRGTSEPAAKGETTPAPEEMLGFIDWISCSFPFKKDAETPDTRAQINNFMAFLGGHWIEAHAGQNGYSNGFRCGGVSLWSGGSGKMGLALQVTGHGCRELELSAIKQGWPAFLSELLERNAKFSRLDVAIDDKMGVLSLDKISHCCDSGLKVTRLRKSKRIFENGGESGGEILTGYEFGTRESDTMLRVYDKALKEGTKGHHIRVELLTRRKRSAALAKKLAGGDTTIVAGLIAATIDFKIKGIGSHRDRWKSQTWWTDFLGGVKKVRLTTDPGQRSLEKSMIALEHQYGMTMAMVVRTYGEPRLLEMARNGEERLKKKEFRTMPTYPSYSDAC